MISMNKRPVRRKRSRKLGTIEREMLSELSLGDLMYGFLLSARSSRRMYKLSRERAAYRYRRKLALERLIADEFVRRQGEKLSMTSRGRDSIATAITANRRLIGAAI